MAGLTERDRNTLSSVFADIPIRYSTHTDFARATVEEILGKPSTPGDSVRIATLASTVFFQRGNRFEPHPLPAIAQWSPATAVVVGDVNGDGIPDIFLAQNWFAVRPEDDRLDGGQGLWLEGDGRGGFRPIGSVESGVQIWGEQRGAAGGDLNGDGKPDLVVTQNGAATRLFFHR